MPFTSQGLTDLYQRRQASLEPEQTGGHVISAIWNALSPETKRVFDKYMGGQYEGAGWEDVAADFLPENPWTAAQPAALGMTKVSGAPGMYRKIDVFHNKTGEWLGDLGYKLDVRDQHPIFQTLQSQSPRATHELLNRFVEEMGPAMNRVEVAPPILPEAIPNFQSWVNRGRLDQWPDLKKSMQGAIDESRGMFRPEDIPTNTRASRTNQSWGLDPSTWNLDEPNPLMPNAAIRRAYVQRPAPAPPEGSFLPQVSDKAIQKEFGMTREQLAKRAREQDDLMDTIKFDW